MYDFGQIISGTPDPNDLLSNILGGTSTMASIKYDDFGINSANPDGSYGVDNARTSPVLPYNGETFAGATITFNTSQFAQFNFASTSLVDNAVTILHELGHVYEYLFGQSSTQIMDDSGSGTISAANTALVKSKCFP